MDKSRTKRSFDDQVHFKKTVPGALVPTKATSLSAGYDFYSTDNYSIRPWGNCLIDTGIAVENIPPDCFLKLESRSGLCLNDKIALQAGVIDSDYTSSVKALLFNFNSAPYQITRGQKICQGIFLHTLGGRVQPVDILSEKPRANSGFGSSDKHE